MVKDLADEKFMRLAIAKAREGIANGQEPFGACVVKGGEVISVAHNTIIEDTDVTAHAEMNAIREACRKLKTANLSGCARARVGRHGRGARKHYFIYS